MAQHELARRDAAVHRDPRHQRVVDMGDGLQLRERAQQPAVQVAVLGGPQRHPGQMHRLGRAHRLTAAADDRAMDGIAVRVAAQGLSYGARRGRHLRVGAGPEQDRAVPGRIGDLAGHRADGHLQCAQRRGV